jgi:hypothetical protein
MDDIDIVNTNKRNNFSENLLEMINIDAEKSKKRKIYRQRAIIA